MPLRRQIFLEAFKLLDLLVMALSFALTTWVVYYQTSPLSFEAFLSMRVKVQNLILFIGFLWAWHRSFSFFGLYRSRRLSSRLTEIADVSKATFFATVVIYVAALVFRIELVTPLFILIFWAAASTVAIASRLVLRGVLKRIRLHGRNLRHMLVVGTNRRAIEFVRKLEAKPELGYRIVGFVDDDWPGIREFQKGGYELVTDYRGFPTYLREHVVDEVVISLPLSSLYEQARRVATLCEEQGLIVRYAPDIFDSKLARSKSDDLEGEPLIYRYTGAMEGRSVLVKRLMDIVVSTFLLLFFSPLFLVTAVLIKITSPGPVLFTQERVGLNKRRFRLYKFRTMFEDAEQKQAELEALNEVSGPVFKIMNDPRISPIGKALRRTSIDELPQLLNILKGDMSLVGPRPLPVRDYNGFSQDWHRRRFSVRPGITCLWQVSGRNSIPFERWMELDMQYIDQWSLWLDLKILFKTIPAVLLAKGAS